LALLLLLLLLLLLGECCSYGVPYLIICFAEKSCTETRSSLNCTRRDVVLLAV